MTKRLCPSHRPRSVRSGDKALRIGLGALLLVAAGIAPSRSTPFDQMSHTTPTDAVPQEARWLDFGASVALEGDVLVVGIPREIDDDAHSGTVRLFDAGTREKLRVLEAADAEARDEFGTSVAIHGGIVAAGAPRKHIASQSSFGAVYLFDAATGEQLRRLVSESGQTFGAAVAISGGRVLVGAPNESVGETSSAGAAYLFDLHTGELVARMSADVPAEDDAFGAAVALDGKVAVVGAPAPDASFREIGGAAYLFNATTGEALGQLLPPSTHQLDRFGSAVAVQGNIVVVGASGRNVDEVFSAGAAYLFDAVTGAPAGTLRLPDLESGAAFGAAVDLSGGRAIVGSPTGSSGNVQVAGIAHLFDLATGELLTQLTAPDPANGDEFGAAVALDGDTAVVGVPADDDFGSNSGSVYLFNATDGAPLHKLPKPGQQFGYSVDVAPGLAIAGAPLRDAGGSASLFDPATGTILRTLVPADAPAGARFGQAVALRQDTAIVGAPLAPSGGVAYLFATDTGQEARLLRAPGAPADARFGAAVAADQTGFVVGAPAAGGTGAAYVFSPAGDLITPLHGAEASDGSQFGAAVAIHGERVVVGAPTDSVQGVVAGAVYVFDFGSGQQLVRFTPEEPSQGTRFGFSVAVHEDTVAVGVRPDFTESSGAVHVFDLNAPGNPPDVLSPLGAAEGFATGLDLENDILAVGAPGRDGIGAVHLFNLTTRRQIGLLEADDSASDQGFGHSLALAGQTLVAGAPFDLSGAAFTFEVDRNGAIKLFPGDPNQREEYGFAVDLRGDTILIGARSDDFGAGAAYFHSATTGAQLGKITGDDTERNDEFGHDVAIDGPMALVGASAHGVAGAAYLFDVASQTQLRKLHPVDAADDAEFGFSVALSGNTAVVGAPRDVGGGATYLFDATTGSQLLRLTADDLPEDDRFGWSVATDGQHVLVGALLAGPEGEGAAYLFAAATGDLIWKWTAPQQDSSRNFGRSVALHGTEALVGANSGFLNPGGAFLFDMVGGQQLFKFELTVPGFGWSVDLDENGVLIGAPAESVGSNADLAGAAYLFDRETREQTDRWIAYQPGFEHEFGHAVALSVGVAVVGDPGGPGDPGEAYLFHTYAGAPEELAIESNPDGMVIRWNGTATLETAPTSSGPWQTVVDQESPAFTGPTDQQRFFRLRF